MYTFFSLKPSFEKQINDMHAKIHLKKANYDTIRFSLFEQELVVQKS